MKCPTNIAAGLDEYLALVIHEMLPRVAQERLAEYCDVFCEPNVFPPEKARLVLQAARALGMGLRVHADQFAPDTGSLLAAELGAVTADHLEASTPAALRALDARACSRCSCRHRRTRSGAAASLMPAP